MNNQNNSTIVNFIWQVADDILRDIYVKGKYRDVILPMTVLTRIDSELIDTKEKVLSEFTKFKDKIKNIEPILERATGYTFYNTSAFTLKSLLKDPKNLRANFKQYLNGYSQNIQDILQKFKFENQIQTLEESGILFALLQKFSDASDKLSPKALSNHDMGYVFEELIRKFNEENNEEAGEHFTPREVIRLMTNLLFLPVKIQIKNKPLSIYDPCVGSGGMLSVSKDFIQGDESEIHSNANIFTFGQEINPETYALCKADMLLKGERDNQVAFGSTLSNDGFPNDKFDFILTNPPYGKSWKTDEDKLASGKKKEILDARFTVGTPRINDGQLLFMLHMISKMKHDTPLGTRIASVHNGSALFTGDAGSGESEIRKHIIEHDYLEAIIALPKEIFYNTGIGTYIWVLTNRKPAHKKGKIQLINATSNEFFSKMTKSLGNKRNELKPEHIHKIYELFDNFKPTSYSKIFDNDDFGYTQIIVERPIRKKLVINNELLEKLIHTQGGDNELNKFKEIVANLVSLKVEKEFLTISELQKECNFDFKSSFYKGLNSFFELFGEVDASGEIITDKKGIPKPDSNLKDKENIPLKDDIQAYFKREVLPFAPDAWISNKERKVGYEINFNKYFYEYTPPRSLEDIAKDIMALETETDGALKEIIR